MILKYKFPLNFEASYISKEHGFVGRENCRKYYGNLENNSKVNVYRVSMDSSKCLLYAICLLKQTLFYRILFGITNRG